MKFLSKTALVASVCVAALFAAMPAKAQSNTFHEVDNVVLQGASVEEQAANTAANAASTGTATSSTAVSAATAVNMGNTASLGTNISATAYQPNGNMGSEVNAVVGQLSDIGSQTSNATANANAVAAASATAISANIANSVVQQANITSLTSQH